MSLLVAIMITGESNQPTGDKELTFDFVQTWYR